MRNAQRLFTCSCLLGAMSTSAMACQSTYEPATGAATLRCVEVPGDPRSFDFALRAGSGNTFDAAATADYDVRQAGVTGLRIVMSPFPVALISGFYPSGCWSAYKRPTVSQTGGTIDIRVRMMALNHAPFACTLAIVPYVQAVPIFLAGDASSQTYFVNGVRMTPIF